MAHKGGMRGFIYLYFSLLGVGWCWQGAKTLAWWAILCQRGLPTPANAGVLAVGRVLVGLTGGIFQTQVSN